MLKITSVNIHGLDALVEYQYYPPSRGARDRFGAPLEPDYPDEIHITKVETFSGEDLTEIISDRIFAEIENKIRSGE